MTFRSLSELSLANISIVDLALKQDPINDKRINRSTFFFLIIPELK